jgi:hypothetical protein
VRTQSASFHPLDPKVKKPVAAYGSGFSGIKQPSQRSSKENGRLIYPTPQAQGEIGMESFRIRLDACDPTRRCWRAYRIEAGTDLLGVAACNHKRLCLQ